ncbi:hypothetical protein B0T22DRAFT_440462 [Podospora appendiculata]|uniref:Uncharacterized protein n=1 Tax=Podospora appendiculata TaxID=314037 RepID=A0AAE1CCV3_9PEZI|nr:hypothetical protein B0T22DRAFT_440462 [Podospora appendiculata]
MEKLYTSVDEILALLWSHDVSNEAHSSLANKAEFDALLDKIHHHGSDIQSARAFLRCVFDGGVKLHPKLEFFRGKDPETLGIVAVLFKVSDVRERVAPAEALFRGASQLASWSPWPRDPRLRDLLLEFHVGTGNDTSRMSLVVHQQPPIPANPTPAAGDELLDYESNTSTSPSPSGALRPIKDADAPTAVQPADMMRRTTLAAQTPVQASIRRALVEVEGLLVLTCPSCRAKMGSTPEKPPSNGKGKRAEAWSVQATAAAQSGAPTTSRDVDFHALAASAFTWLVTVSPASMLAEPIRAVGGNVVFSRHHATQSFYRTCWMGKPSFCIVLRKFRESAIFPMMVSRIPDLSRGTNFHIN